MTKSKKKYLIVILIFESGRNFTQMSTKSFYDALLIKEIKYTPSVTSVVNDQLKLRTIAVNWIIQLHIILKMPLEALYLCVNFYDRFLSLNARQLSALGAQKLICAALWVASKLEEDEYLLAKHLHTTTPKVFNKRNLINTEKILLKSLQYEVSVPTAYTFLTRWLDVISANKLLHDTAEKILIRILPTNEFLRHKPSLIAATVLYASMEEHEMAKWNVNLEYHTGYMRSDLLLEEFGLNISYSSESTDADL